MKDSQKGYTSIGLVFIIFWLVAITGWIMNIVEIVHSISDPITGMFVFRCVGVFFAPLGAILGYF